MFVPIPSQRILCCPSRCSVPNGFGPPFATPELRAMRFVLSKRNVGSADSRRKRRESARPAWRGVGGPLLPPTGPRAVWGQARRPQTSSGRGGGGGHFRAAPSTGSKRSPGTFQEPAAKTSLARSTVSAGETLQVRRQGVSETGANFRGAQFPGAEPARTGGFVPRWRRLQSPNPRPRFGPPVRLRARSCDPS